MMSSEFSARLRNLERRVQTAGVLSGMLSAQIAREERDLQALMIEAGDMAGAGRGAFERQPAATGDWGIPTPTTAPNMGRFLR